MGLKGVWRGKRRGSTGSGMKDLIQDKSWKPRSYSRDDGSEETASLVTAHFFSGHLVSALRALNPISCQDVGQVYMFFITSEG